MKRDYEVFESVQKELDRQRQNIELIASENFVSNQINMLKGIQIRDNMGDVSMLMK